MHRLGLALMVLVACDAAPPTEEEAPYEAVCTDLETVPCVTQFGESLPLHDAVAAGTLSSAIDGNDWVVDVDATAGGFLDAPDNPWLYVRFTDEGAQKVEITDVDSLDSAEWHVAFHRFRVRLNGGSAGPSCVSAAAFPDKAYADLVPEDAAGGLFETDAFFDASCTFLSQEDDPDAPPGIPVAALNDWWTYPDCVATTAIPFLVRLDTGRLLKLEVLRYYGAGQEQCNTEGTMGSESANIQMKWAFVH